MCTAVENSRTWTPLVPRTPERRCAARVGAINSPLNTGTDRPELPESINAGWKHEYPRNRASDYRAREDFHAYRHPRLSGQSRADQGEAEGLAHRRRRCPRQRDRVPFPGLLNANGPLYQDVAGRIMHQQKLAEATPPGLHRQVQLTQRAMDALGIDYMVVFPTPMLSLGMHPQTDAEVALGNAYNRWLIEEILPQDKRQKALLYLPFNDPDACVETVERFADAPGVVGFSVTSTRHKPVWHNSYMRLYAALQETGKPLGFHAGFSWADPSFQQLNRFIGMHSLSFVHFNMVHMTNWVLNGLPERFPKLKVIWIESGLAWVPFVMQRLDSEYMMRTS